MTKSVVLSLGLVGLLSTPLWAQDLPPDAPPATSDAPRVATQANTEAHLESFLTNLIHRQPDAAWGKIYLPVLPDGKRYHAEAVARLLKAQADVYRSPDKSPPKTVVIQGRWMTVEEAQPVIKALRLEPVYVLMKRDATAASLVEIGQDQRLSILSTSVNGVTFIVSFLPPSRPITHHLTPEP